jgi:hypothetical protein
MLNDVVRAAHAAVKREDWHRAWTLLNQALNDEPDMPEALYLMGATLRGIGNVGLAVHVLRKALAQDQKQVNLWMTYGATLHDLNQWDAARDALKIAHSLVPNDPMPIANIGATYVQQGKWREAIEWVERALKIDPDCHIARISRNFCYLSLGRWQNAWADAEWLYGRHLGVRVYNPKGREEPMWDGTKGQVVVVQADQGVGDIIMFAQCLPNLIADCKEVILECAARMEPLMRRSFPQLTIYSTLKDQSQGWAEKRLGTEDEVQAHVHISYLGNWYRRLDKDFTRVPYLKIDPDMVEWWRGWMADYPRPWVGIAWQGGIQATQKHLRSVALEDMAPVIKSGGTMFDLSYQDNRLEVSRWNIDHAEQVVVPKINKDDFDATASFIAALDDVVTVTTTVAHVCGAIGKRAHVLVPAVPQWRYAYRHGDGTSMIWYPPDSVLMHRQAPGETEWKPTIKRAVAALKASR